MVEGGGAVEKVLPGEPWRVVYREELDERGEVVHGRWEVSRVGPVHVTRAEPDEVAAPSDGGLTVRELSGGQVDVGPVGGRRRGEREVERALGRHGVLLEGVGAHEDGLEGMGNGVRLVDRAVEVDKAGMQLVHGKEKCVHRTYACAIAAVSDCERAGTTLVFNFVAGTVLQKN